MATLDLGLSHLCETTPGMGPVSLPLALAPFPSLSVIIYIK